MKIVLTVKTLYIQEGYKCLILAEGAQKVGDLSCYFSNSPAQRLTTLVSHSEANPKNNWMRGEQACLEIYFQMESFPVEVLENIVKFLPPKDRKAAVLVSSRLVKASHFLDSLIFTKVQCAA